MKRIFGATVMTVVLALVFAVEMVNADAGVLVETDTDTVMKIRYMGNSPSTATPVLFVTGGKPYGAIVEGTGRALTGVIPGYATPLTGLASGVAAAGPIGISAYGTGGSSPVIGGHFMTNSTNTWGLNYGIEVRAHGGGSPLGIYARASGGSSGNNWAAWFEGSTYATGTYQGSDRMFKTNIEDYSDGLTKVMALKPKSYDSKIEEFKNEMDLPKGRQIGLIAQELQEVIPELVKDVEAPPQLSEEERKAGVQKEGLKFKAVNYTGLIPVLIAAIQEQQARIEALEARGK